MPGGLYFSEGMGCAETPIGTQKINFLTHRLRRLVLQIDRYPSGPSVRLSVCTWNPSRNPETQFFDPPNQEVGPIDWPMSVCPSVLSSIVCPSVIVRSFVRLQISTPFYRKLVIGYPWNLAWSEGLITRRKSLSLFFNKISKILEKISKISKKISKISKISK